MILRKGQTLVEVIVAIAIMAVIVVGLVSASRQSVRTEQSARAESDATKLAEEGIEQIKAVYNDQSFDKIQTNTCYYPFYNSSSNKWDIDTCKGGNNLITPPGSTITFTRKIYAFDTTGAVSDAVCVYSVVFWNDQKGPRNAYQQTIIAKNKVGQGGNSNSSKGCDDWTGKITYP